MSAINIKNLEMRFGNFTALSDINLSVAAGEFVTLLGPSGCGKTTLLKLLSGFLTPSQGRILMNGTDITTVPPEGRDTALCFQSYALFPHLSVRENLEFGLRQKKIPKDARRNRLAAVAAQLELEPQLGKLPNQLSGGQQQRVALGRALVMQPSVILFDEPLSNLDARLRDAVRIEIRRIQRDNNLTAIYVTHDQSEALALSDRVIVLNAGKVEQIASPRTLYDRPATSFVADFIGGANIMPAEVIEEVGGGRWVLQTPLGKLTSAAGGPPKAKHINLCWRPEHVRLHTADENNFDLTFKDQSYQGSFTDLFATIGAHEFRLQSRDHDLPDGGDLTCSIAPENLVMLEAIT